MADEDVQVTSDDESPDEGGDAQIAGLPPYVDAIIQGYGKQFGRVISRKLVRSKDPTKDRDRLVVTYENGQSQRKAVTFRIGAEGVAPSSLNPAGTPAETTIVESVEDVKAPTAPRPPAAARPTSSGSGKPYIDDDEKAGASGRRWGYNPQTDQYDRDLGPSPAAQEIAANAALPADQDPRAETNAQRTARGTANAAQANINADNARAERATNASIANANKPDVKIQDDGKGGVVAIVTDKDGKVTTQTVQGVAGKPNQVTVAGTVYEKGPDGTYKPVAGEGATAPLPAGVAPYKPDYSLPDLGLTARRDELEQLRRDGKIDAAQAIATLKSDAALADVTRVHGDNQAQTITTVHGQQVTERGQDIADQENRRTNATNVYQTTFNGINSGAAKMGRGGGNAAAAAFMEALQIGLQNAQNWGGMKDVPNTDIGSIKLTTKPDGSISIQVPHRPANPAAGDPSGAGAAQADAAAQGEPDAQQQAAQARGPLPAPLLPPQSPVNVPPSYHGAGGQTSVDQPAWMPSTGDPSNPTNEVNPGAVGQVPDYLQTARSQPIQYDPSGVIARLRRDPRVSDDVVAQALAELQGAA